MIRKYLLPLLAGALLIFAVYHVVRGQQAPPRAQAPIEPAHNPFGDTVAGSGIAEAETENISIGSALPGVVLEVYVPVDRVGQWVKAGDRLFRVDDRALKAQLKLNEANLAAANAQLAKLEAMPRPEELPSSEAKVHTAEGNLALVEDQYERAQKLFPGPAMSQEEFRQRKFAVDVARQQWMQAKKDYDLLRAGAWEPDKVIARTAVAQAQAQVEQTRTDLDRAVVRAPVDGQVIQVNVRPGEYVSAAAGQALVVLGNLKKMHVRVDIDEHDIPRFKPGAPGRAALRGNPQQEYPLTFVRVEPYVIPKKSLTGDNTERVDTRVLQVIYALDSSEKPIYVGQQLDVFIDTAAAPAGTYP